MAVFDIWFIITQLGSPELWVGIAALIFGIFVSYRIFEKKGKTADNLKRLLFILIPILLLTFVLAFSTKSIINIPRVCVPCDGNFTMCNPYCPHDSALPSGHASIAFAGFTALWIFSGMKKKYLLIYILPFLVAVSRLVLGVHTWLDVFVGAVMGTVIAIIVHEIDKRV